MSVEELITERNYLRERLAEIVDNNRNLVNLLQRADRRITTLDESLERAQREIERLRDVIVETEVENTDLNEELERLRHSNRLTNDLRNTILQRDRENSQQDPQIQISNVRINGRQVEEEIEREMNRIVNESMIRTEVNQMMVRAPIVPDVAPLGRDRRNVAFDIPNPFPLRRQNRVMFDSEDEELRVRALPNRPVFVVGDEEDEDVLVRTCITSGGLRIRLIDTEMNDEDIETFLSSFTCETCPICLELVEENPHVSNCSCHAVYHPECFNQMIEQRCNQIQENVSWNANIHPLMNRENVFQTDPQILNSIFHDETETCVRCALCRHDYFDGFV